MLDEEPYCSINNGTFKGEITAPKISVKQRAMKNTTNESVRAYIESKFYGEDLAAQAAAKNISTICLRFGAVSSTNIPYEDATLLPRAEFDFPLLYNICCSLLFYDIN